MNEPRELGVATIESGELRFEMAGTGPVVVFVHGNFMDARMWGPQFDAFAEGFTAVRYDVRGFGASPRAAGPYSHRGDLRALLARLGHDRAHLVGVSMGGEIVVETALEFPDLAASLVVVPGWSLESLQWAEEGWEAIGAAVRDHDHLRAREIIMDFPPMRSLMARPDLRDSVAHIMDAYPWRDFEAEEEYVSIDPPAMGRLAEIGCPTLVISGALDDPAFLDTGGFIAREVPGARRIVIPDAGHMVNMEQPAAFNRAVRSFITEAQANVLPPR
jgi:pimeloyl-ACP methyl ester carboxylesterase